ncbi:hypothetical protein AB0P17_36755 [Streptomyces sp. NPDC088124]|uniref:hypothetical protein n=1 Tax=Streptomyces sp. NPDC088124 TaxID=3154654 RepID=UPI00341A4419
MIPARITRSEDWSEAAITTWLLKAAADPKIAEKDWEENRPAMLPLGERFDAVKMPPNLVYAATASTVPAQVCDILATLVDGPVVCHPSVWYYALVPAGTTETWRSPDALILGRGAWLGVPRLTSTRPDPPLPYWAVPPEKARKLCTPEVVADLLQAGAARLTPAPPSHAELYRARLDHLESCAECSAGSVCETGAALRKVEREGRDGAQLP